MENETIIRLSETNYQVLKVTYGYDDEYDFFVSAEIRLPEDVAPEDGILTAAFRIEFVLESAEKHNPAMVRYVKTMIDSYMDVSFWDRVAFEALEEEGFDLEQLIRYSVNEMKIKFVKLEPTE